MATRPTKSPASALIQVTVIEGVFTAPQKREMVVRLTDAMVSIEGEKMRRHVWCLVTEIASGHWSAGGEALLAADMRAFARRELVKRP